MPTIFQCWLTIRSTGPIAACRHLGYKSLAQMPTHRNGPVSSNVTVKAPHVEAELSPPAGRQDWQGRWARPLDFSGESSAVGGRCDFGRGPLADQLELLDPARRVFLRTHGRVVDVLTVSLRQGCLFSADVVE